MVGAVPWQSARVPRRSVHFDWEKTNAASTLDAYKILAVYLRPNERSSHITCLLLKILKAMYFNGLKLVACGSIERRYFKQCSGLD